MTAKPRWCDLLASVLVTLILVTGSAGVAPASAAKRGRTSEDTAALLRQLTEMQQELRAMRDEVAQLRQAVADLARAGARPRPSPPPLPASVTLDDDPVLGSSQAPVAVVEFSEFECPFCRRFHEQTFSKLKEVYVATGKVQYVFRDFPLPMHAQAKPAALAAHCAARQDAFWPMHDALFENQQRLGPELFPELARRLGLDGDGFLACLSESAAQKEVEGDIAYGQGLGVQGTPTFFIGRLQGVRLVNPQRLTGAQPFSAFSEAIDALLK
jgi:protein-disulfide isomerase